MDVALRAGGGALVLALALLLLRDGRRQLVPWLFLPFALGLCGFLARNTPDGELQLTGGAAAAALFLSGNAAIFLWWFALSMFDDAFRLDRFKLGVGALWLAISTLDRGFLGERFSGLGLGWATVILGLGLVVHLGYRLLRDLDEDLVEGRRRARIGVAAGLGLLLLVDLGFDLVFGFDFKPRWFTMGQNAAIVAFTLGLGAWLVRADVGALAFRRRAPESRAGVEPDAETVPAAGAGLLGRLQRLMLDERIYRDPELTFSAFARRMGAPEPEVRRLVNRALGHRHFRSFLNAYRVAEAREALVDPARSGEKIVGIAMDVGFASLASFNRAFKEVEGRSPSEYRAAQAGTGGAGLRPEIVF